MLDLLLSVVVAALVVALGLGVLAALTLAPFVVALQLAERDGVSTVRWGAVTLAGSVVGLLVVLLLLRSDSVSTPIALLPLALTWAGPVLLRVVDPHDARLAGRAGRHE